MTPPRDPFDPDHPPPHWRDEDGNFGGWLTETEAAALSADEDGTTAVDLFAANDASDDDWLYF